MSSKIILLALVLVGISGCTSLGSNPAEMILGQWQTDVGGFPLVVTYSETTAQTDGAAPVAYELSGDRLSYADGGKQVRIVSFPEPGLMQQLDPMTGTEHSFTKVSP